MIPKCGGLNSREASKGAGSGMVLERAALAGSETISKHAGSASGASHDAPRSLAALCCGLVTRRQQRRPWEHPIPKARWCAIASPRLEL